jgi:predicted hotdog family 3-hydroxylacyl-ACP dehydratase
MSTSEPSAFPNIQDLIPHRGHNLLLGKVLHADGTSVIVSGQVPFSGWYLEQDKTMPSWISIEMMAQAIAVHIGLESRQHGGPVKPGMLIGCKSLEILISAFEASEKFRVRAEVVYRDDSGFAAYDCVVSGKAGDMAKATLKAYQPENFKTFMAQLSS